MSNMHEHYGINQLISRFSNSFDLKAWGDLKDCLTESIYTDYSELRGTPPETMSGIKFVELRRQALQHLKTHHLAGNGEISITGDEGSVRVSMIIYRKDESGEVLNTHCLYLFGVKKVGETWKICSIVQKVFWSDGDTSIHQGIRKK